MRSCCAQRRHKWIIRDELRGHKGRANRERERKREGEREREKRERERRERRQ